MLTDKFNASLFLLPDQHVSKLVETATKIAIENFEWRYITFIIFNSTMLYGVESLLRMYDKSCIIGQGLFYPHFAEQTRQYILFGANITNIGHMLDWMRFHQFDNTGKHIVICESQEKQQCEETDAVEILWDHKITDVVFLKSGNNNEVLGYTYFPLKDDCNRVKPVKLNKLDFCKADVNCQEMFPMKLKNIHRCPIMASVYQQVPYMQVLDGVPTGADGDLLRTIAEGLNATLHVMDPRRGFGWGYLDDNGRWMGSLGDVYDNLANFSMTSGAVTLSRFSYFQLSIAYYTARILWVTHPTPLQPSSLKLLRPLQFSTQAAIVTSFVLVIAVAFFVRSRYWAEICRKIYIKPPHVSIVFYSWLLCMGLPLIRLPTHQAILSIIVLWILYCFLLRTIYQVCLIAVLQSNYYFSEFNTIKEAYAADYPFGGGVALRDYYINDSLVFNNWQIIDTKDIIPTLFEIANGKKFVLAMSGENAITMIRTSNLQVHILQEKVVITPTVIFFKKFSPFAKPINAILRRLIESGIVDKLYKNYMKEMEPKDYDTYGPIHADDYKGCYFILLAGWSTSTAFFILEILYAKYDRFCNSLFSFEVL